MAEGYCLKKGDCACTGMFREARELGTCYYWVKPDHKKKLDSLNVIVQLSKQDIEDLLVRKKLTKSLREKLVDAQYDLESTTRDILSTGREVVIHKKPSQATLLDVLSYETGAGATYHMAIVEVEGKQFHSDGYLSEKGRGSLVKVAEEVMRRWPDTDRKALEAALTVTHFMNLSRGTDSSGLPYPRKL